MRFYISELSPSGPVHHRVRRIETERGLVYYYRRQLSPSMVGYSFGPGYVGSGPFADGRGDIYFEVTRAFSPQEKQAIENEVRKKEIPFLTMVLFTERPVTLRME